MPLLRFDPADTKAMSKVPVEICLFLWRGLRASGRETSQRISLRANRAAGSGYGADEAAVSGNSWCVRRRGAGHSSWDANAGEGTRFSAGDAGRRRECRFFAEPAGFSRGGTDFSVVDTGGGARGTRRAEGARADSDILSRALCDSRCGQAGLQRVLRARVAFSANDGVPAVHFTSECDRAVYEPGKNDPGGVAAFWIVFSTRRRERAHPGAGDGAAGAVEEGTPVPVPAEVAEAFGADEAA